MYESFYSLKEKPFSLNPDPRFFYASKEHNRVLAYLHYGIKQGEGFIVVTGDVGTGKTTLVSALRHELAKDKNIICHDIVTTQLGPEDLLRIIATSFGIEAEGLSKSALLNFIQKHLKEQMNRGKRVLLIVDEAQNLEPHSLEELRMLSNYQQGEKPLLQSFLLGQAEFRDILRQPNLEQFRQRIIASYHLGPLGQVETRGYIEHRLKVSGWKSDPHISHEAYNDIYSHTNGVPRRINTLCDRVLLYAFSEQLHDITVEVVQSVLKELDEELHFNRIENKQNGVARRPSANGSVDALENLEQRVARLEDIVNKARDLIQGLIKSK